MTDKEKIERALEIIGHAKEGLNKHLFNVKCNIESQKQKILDLMREEGFLIGTTVVPEAKELEYLIKLQARFSIRYQEYDVLEGILKGETDALEEKNDSQSE